MGETDTLIRLILATRIRTRFCMKRGTHLTTASYADVDFDAMMIVDDYLWAWYRPYGELSS